MSSENSLIDERQPLLGEPEGPQRSTFPDETNISDRQISAVRVGPLFVSLLVDSVPGQLNPSPSSELMQTHERSYSFVCFAKFHTNGVHPGRWTPRC